MTDGSPAENGSPMCVRIWLEVGHVCEPRRRSPLGRALALDWRVWVRGAAGGDISRFVHKVVFYLHPASAFVYPKRVIQEPPYEIQESGCASIEIPIHVYLKYSNKPKKIRLKYNLRVENESQAKSDSQCVYYDFENPPEQLWRSLMQGGGEAVARTELPPPARSAELVLVGGEDTTPQRKSSSSAYEFVAPVHRQPTSRRTTDAIHNPCPLCGKSTLVDFNKHLSTVSMTKDEISRASHVYLSYKSYERSIDALVLPPLSDSIYKLPELPKSLRDSLQKDKFDK